MESCCREKSRSFSRWREKRLEKEAGEICRWIVTSVAGAGRQPQVAATRETWGWKKRRPQSPSIPSTGATQPGGPAGRSGVGRRVGSEGGRRLAELIVRDYIA